jgi:hypothetical protein
MTLHATSQCEQLYKEVKYKKDALNDMLKRQYDLQVFMHEKRGTIKPPANFSEVTQETTLDAIYYITCMNLEFNELLDAFNDERISVTEAKYELIDVYHFLMNVFIFAGISSFDKCHSLEFLWTIGAKEEKEKSDADIVVLYYVGEINKILARLIDVLPYKKWKTYPADLKLNEKSITVHALQSIVNIIELAKEMGITKEEFYSLYVTKNQENYERQINALKGYL